MVLFMRCAAQCNGIVEINNDPRCQINSFRRVARSASLGNGTITLAGVLIEILAIILSFLLVTPVQVIGKYEKSGQF